MAQITDNQKQHDLNALESLLNSLEIPAQFYAPGNLFPDFSLVTILPTNYVSDEFAHEEISDDTFNNTEILAFSYIFQLEDDEDALTKQLLTYFALNQSVDELDPLTLYQAVNALNLRMSSGCFTLEPANDQLKLSLQYRFVLSAPVDEDFSEECFFQCLTEMVYAAETASMMIDAIKKGIDFEEFLEHPQAFLDSNGFLSANDSNS